MPSINNDHFLENAIVLVQCYSVLGPDYMENFIPAEISARLLKLILLGPDYMANFIPGWNFSRANRAEISDRLLKQILWKPSCRLHGEGFSPAKRAWKSEKVPCNRNVISARADKGTPACPLTVFSHLSKLSREICVSRPGWNWACNRNNISAQWAERNFSPGGNSSCNKALRTSMHWQNRSYRLV